MRYAPIDLAATSSAPEADKDLAARMASLLGSRLCHDLVSPLGAIGNGIELLEMSGDWPGLQASPEMALIGDALQAARGRIAMFRIAFGAATGSQRLSQAELAGLIADIEKTGRMKITLEASGDHARGLVKLIMLALMCLETAMPWGAKVAIRQEGRDWVVSAQAERTRGDQLLWSWLDGPRPELAVPAASEVHFPLLGLSAREAGREIRWSLTETTAGICF